MRPAVHTAASGLVSIVFAYWTKSWPGTLACFLSGIFIDLDHVLDYWLARKRLLFTYKELFYFCAKEKEGKLYLVLHSYEFIALFWFMVYYYQWPVVWLGAAVGVSVHIFLDQLDNPIRPWVYFLCYRFRHGFVREFIFSEEYYKKLPDDS